MQPVQSKVPVLKTPWTGQVWFDRRISSELLGALRQGPLHPLIERRQANPLLLDVQLRRHATDAKHSWTSLYVGLTSVLHVHERLGNYWLNAHKTWRDKGHFDQAWSEPKTLKDLAASWPAVEDYLDRIIPSVDGHHTDHEGKVHAAICAGSASSYVVVNREASPSFDSDATKSNLTKAIGDPLWEAVTLIQSQDPWWPGLRYALKGKRFGTSPDVLAIDGSGRLLVIEAKPADALEGITWGPAQVRFYADMFAVLFKHQPNAASHIHAMLEQRIELGLSTGQVQLSSPIRIVPVLAIGAGLASRQAIMRATMVQDAVNKHVRPKAPVTRAEIWVLHTDGEPSLVLK